MLIGSRALAHWVPEFVCSDKKDWDFIGEQTVPVPEGDRIEIHPLDHLNNRDALQFNEGGVCSLWGLSMIKRSHLWRDYKFDSHITMYHKFLVKGLGSTAIKHFSCFDFYNTRVKLTKEAYPQGNPKLNQSNDSFFDDAVAKVWDHDWLHELYSYGDRPMYERLKQEGGMSEAWCKKDLWQGLSHEDKCKCVAEEC